MVWLLQIHACSTNYCGVAQRFVRCLFIPTHCSESQPLVNFLHVSYHRAGVANLQAACCQIYIKG